MASLTSFAVASSFCHAMFDSISLYRALGFEVKKPDIIKMVHEVDPTNTGTVDYEQFLEIMELNNITL